MCLQHADCVCVTIFLYVHPEKQQTEHIVKCASYFIEAHQRGYYTRIPFVQRNHIYGITAENMCIIWVYNNLLFVAGAGPFGRRTAQRASETAVAREETRKNWRRQKEMADMIEGAKGGGYTLQTLQTNNNKKWRTTKSVIYWCGDNNVFIQCAWNSMAIDTNHYWLCEKM